MACWLVAWFKWQSCRENTGIIFHNDFIFIWIANRKFPWSVDVWGTFFRSSKGFKSSERWLQLRERVLEVLSKTPSACIPVFLFHFFENKAHQATKTAVQQDSFCLYLFVLIVCKVLCCIMLYHFLRTICYYIIFLLLPYIHGSSFPCIFASNTYFWYFLIGYPLIRPGVPTVSQPLAALSLMKNSKSGSTCLETGAIESTTTAPAPALPPTNPNKE